jgi:hypothetical protein
VFVFGEAAFQIGKTDLENGRPTDRFIHRSIPQSFERQRHQRPRTLPAADADADAAVDGDASPDGGWGGLPFCFWWWGEWSSTPGLLGWAAGRFLMKNLLMLCCCMA